MTINKNKIIDKFIGIIGTLFFVFYGEQLFKNASKSLYGFLTCTIMLSIVFFCSYFSSGHTSLFKFPSQSHAVVFLWIFVVVQFTIFLIFLR